MTTSTLKSTIQSAKSGLGAFDLLAKSLFNSARQTGDKLEFIRQLLLKALNNQTVNVEYKLSGNHNKALRANLLSTLTGNPVKEYQAGITALLTEVYKQTGIDKLESTFAGAKSRYLENWLATGDFNKSSKDIKIESGDTSTVADRITELTDLIKAYRELGETETANTLQSELDALLGDSNTIEPEGDDSNVKTSKGSKVSTKFTVVEASKLIVSHDEQGKPNPEYPKEFQPRDRARETSQAWVQRVAKDLEPSQLGESRNAAFGAPIIGKDRVVESGNGRAAAIILAYKLNFADEYKAWILKNAKTFGVSESKIKGMKRPVLVRVRTSDVDRVQFAMEANQSDMLAMTATEKAKSDANRLNDALMSRLSGDGDLNSLANRDFIMDFLKSLGESEAAQYSTTDGMPTKQLYDRVQAALFAKAYNDDRLLEMMAESEKVEIANTIKALNQAAPHFIRARAISHKVTDGVTRQVGDAVELSLDDQAVNALIEATNVIKAAKNSGMSLEEYLKQTNVFGDDVDPVVAQMAIFIKENNRSSNRMGVAFQTMAEFVADELERRQNESLFVDNPEIELLDVLKAANERLKKQFGDDVKTIGGGTGGFIDIFTETRGQKKDREAFLANQPPKVTDNANIDMLKAVINGDYDNESSEALLNRIETAMNGVSFDYDAIMLDGLVSKAMDKWLEVDNKVYLLDSVDTSGIIGWFDNTRDDSDICWRTGLFKDGDMHGIVGWFDNADDKLIETVFIRCKPRYKGDERPYKVYDDKGIEVSLFAGEKYPSYGHDSELEKSFKSFNDAKEWAENGGYLVGDSSLILDDTHGIIGWFDNSEVA